MGNRQIILDLKEFQEIEAKAIKNKTEEIDQYAVFVDFLKYLQFEKGFDAVRAIAEYNIKHDYYITIDNTVGTSSLKATKKFTTVNEVPKSDFNNL